MFIQLIRGGVADDYYPSVSDFTAQLSQNVYISKCKHLPNSWVVCIHPHSDLNRRTFLSLSRSFKYFLMQVDCANIKGNSTSNIKFKTALTKVYTSICHLLVDRRFPLKTSRQSYYSETIFKLTFFFPSPPNTTGRSVYTETLEAYLSFILAWRLQSFLWVYTTKHRLKFQCLYKPFFKMIN